MLAHADKYSQAFSIAGGIIKTKNGQKTKACYADYEAGNYDQSDEWLYSSFWYKDFDGMAYKTMLRQLISKWGIMSIDMQEAYTKDMATIKENGDYEYIDSIEEPIEESIQVQAIEIENNTTEGKADENQNIEATEENQESNDEEFDFFN